MIDTSLDSSNFYFLVAVLQGLVLSGIILFQKPRQKPNLYLGILIFLCSLSLLHIVLEKSIHVFNAKFPVPMDFSLAYGPLIYLHVLSIIKPRGHRTRRYWLHFLPSLLLDGLAVTIVYTYLGQNYEWGQANLLLIQSIGVSASLIGSLQLGVYTYLIYRLLKQKDELLREFAAVEKWPRLILTWSCVLIASLVIAMPIALYYIELLDDNSFVLYILLGGQIGLGIYLMGYAYLTKFGKPVQAYIRKVVNLKFTHSEMEAQKTSLLESLEKEALYTDPDLTVAKLASQVNMPVNDLSQLINEGMKTNFTDLINQYRVEAFIRLCEQPDSHKYSLLGLAEEAGFSSKASFYRIFKKETGMTPNAYLKAKTGEKSST